MMKSLCSFLAVTKRCYQGDLPLNQAQFLIPDFSISLSFFFFWLLWMSVNFSLNIFPNCLERFQYFMFVNGIFKYLELDASFIACVASVSVEFGSKNFSFLGSRPITRAGKTPKINPVPRCFFRTRCVVAPKSHGNVPGYAGCA